MEVTIERILPGGLGLAHADGRTLMVPLAATSTNGMIKRLGGARWKKLHRLVYVAAIAGVVHYYMLVKADVRQPVAFAVALGILFAYRILESRFAFLRRGRATKVATT